MDALHSALSCASQHSVPVTTELGVKMKEITRHHTGFFELFEPTAELVYECIFEEKRSEISAILQSILLIEAAANCCIFDLNLNKKLGDELDKLSIFAKFDTYLLVKTAGSKSLNRGDYHCQNVAELISLRNSIVHPKLYRMNWLVESDEHESSTGYHLKTDRLKISQTCSGWVPNDSITVFKAVVEFISYFFIDTCNLTEQKTRLLLLTTPDDDADDIWVDSVRLRALQDRCNIKLQLWGVGVE